nr:uncharacterized protein LOC128700182 isoform X1 [Cherax quadricarinatus]XP_053649190.1 uncharacterized protein LOC128700182 isoform X1 [Cherax quadricarinatus]XP_053649191.1 uncharacterized protein LOC128700182 isoform X1 [Cherax quadricarinatus]XP_053649192.1 uncharacterized protein LOC128700182 isoform X1 [Cherax quadricarinatus]
MASVKTMSAGEEDFLLRRIKLKVNGQDYVVGSGIPPWTTLIGFLRETVKLAGTKVLCWEGGCGACTIVATVPDQETAGKFKTFSVNACQILVYSCAGWSIETIEHLGDRHKGYHSLQKALSGFYGTQCGYCSPGMIMTMYGQLKASGALTASQVEHSLDGNLCRCTGYRPILDAFKSLAEDASQQLKDKLADIEDAYKAHCPETGSACKRSCSGCTKGSDSCSGSSQNEDVTQPEDFKLTVGAIQWYRPVSIQGIKNILKKVTPNEKVCIVVGNTGQGVYKDDGPYTTYINSNSVKELYSITIGSPLTMGANVSLSRVIEVFKHMAISYPGYQYLKTFQSHWELVANVSVRNIGSWAGNLMLKHKHPEFPSDIFLTLLLANAQLTLCHADSLTTTQIDLEQFLQTDMSRGIILSVTLPPMPENVKVQTFKISPRTVNAHAHVNACFKMKLDPVDVKILEKPFLLFGGINADFIHAEQTEAYLVGKYLTEVVTVVEAAKILANEMTPDAKPQDASPQYRKSLAQSLFYKAVVGFLGDKVSGDIRSAAAILERPLSSGQQGFDMNEDTWPVGKGVPKVESTTQISGEAAYLDDVPPLHNELHGAFVQSSFANAKIKSIDASEALKIPGVVSFVAAADIPGRNSFIVNAGARPDPVFVEEQVKYAGQALGLIVADQRATALRAAKQVIVEYEDIKKPILTIKEALQQGRSKIVMSEPYIFGNPEDALNAAKHKVTGEQQQGSQFHFTMEALAGRVTPTEDGYDVLSTSQWPTETQSAVAQVLNVPAHSINLAVRRIGGGFGGKISRQNIVVSAAAVAAEKLKRPVRIVLDLQTHMSLVGWREPYMSKYEVGFDDDGKFEALKVDMITDVGHVANEASVSGLGVRLQNTYYIPNVLFRPIMVKTNTAANTWCRTPGTVEAIATIENVIENVASYLKKDPLDVRLINMVAPNVPRLLTPPHARNVVNDDILPLLIQKSMYQERKEEIKIFNQENVWKKRGMSIVPLWYGYNYPSVFRYGIQVSIYEHDGTVAVSHGGIEMGQGINTKVAQVVAYKLGIPLEKVIIKAADTMVGANSIVTGGSFGSDLCAHGAKVACEALRQRIDVVRAKMKNPSWVQLIRKCHKNDVDICERYWTAGKEHPDSYDIWGACCLEVEIDVLTGQYLIRRVDIIEDCGRSMNPYIDIGQVEGAFIMGLGLYTSEIVKYDTNTGQKLSNSTWEYKPPTALDIPVDLRVTLLPNASNPHGVLGSKATGEPAACFSYVVVTALRAAITAFRAANENEAWFDMDTPITVEKVHQLCGVQPEQFKLSTSTDEFLDDFCLISKDQVYAEVATFCPVN